MRFLRMLTNAGLAGLLGAAYVEMLVLQLNPGMPLAPRTVLPLFGLLILFYGVLLTAACFLLVVSVQLFAERPLSPGWLSVRLLAWLGSLVTGLGSLLMWINLRGFGAALEAGASRRMALGAVATGLSGLALLTVAVMHDSFGRRGSRLSGAILATTLLVAITTPLAIRGPARQTTLGSQPLVIGEIPGPPNGSRVIVIALDGASLDFISPAVAEGRLPNFGTILDRGASMHLVTLRPTQPGPVWTAVATGKYPPKNGVPSAASHRWSSASTPIELLPDLCFFRGLVYAGLLSEEPHTSAALRARPLWSILSGQGIAVGVVGWPLTYPAQPVRGYLASERLYSAVDSRNGQADPDLAFPQEAFARARDVLHEVDREEQTVVLTGAQAEPLVDTSLPGTPTGRDRAFRRVAAVLQARLEAQFVAVRYQGLDTVGHRFLRYANPRSFGDVSEEERRRFGGVLERYYGFIDAEVGLALEALGPDDLLLVVSGFGMEPVSLGKRLLARVLGDPDLSGSHERAPDGFMLAYGSAVEPGRAPLGAIVDVAPTVLYFLGLPVARDMDGFARTDLFTRAFTSQQPITFIPTHDR